MDAKKGDWVQIHRIELEPKARSTNLPEDTQKVPLEVWQKGFINHDASIGNEVEIETVIGRKVKGELVEVNPVYDHDFGKPVPELLTTGKDLRKLLEGGNK
jgi:NifB/MoaA-like Fe-S oxidoreductase